MLRSLTGGILILASLTFVGLAIGGKPAAEKAAPRLKTQRREPVALVALGKHVLAANRQSGTITVIDRADGNILAEYRVADRIADMVPVGDSSSLFVLDDKRRALLTVSWQDEKPIVRVVAELPVSGSKLVFDQNRRTAFITAKWSHRLLAIELDENLTPVGPARSLELPFVPLELLLLPARNTLIVAEAFGRRLGIIDAEKMKVKGIRETEGHNIRGLAQRRRKQHVDRPSADSRRGQGELRGGALGADGFPRGRGR